MSLWTWLNNSDRDVSTHASNIDTMMEQIIEWYTAGGTGDPLGVAAIYRARQLNSDVPASLPVYAGTFLIDDSADRVAETLLSLQANGDAYWKIDRTGDWTVYPYADVQAKWNDAKPVREYWHTPSGVKLRTEGDARNLVVLSVNRAAGDLTGMGWLESDAIQSALAIDRYATSYFKNNGRPTGTLQAAGNYTKTEAEEFLAQWNVNHGEDAERRPAFLSGGITFNPDSFSASDSAWVESHRASVLDVAAISGVPTHFLASSPAGSSLNYSNNSDLWRMYWAQTLNVTYIPRVERAWSELIGSEVKFDPAQLLIASLRERADAASVLVRSGYDPDTAAVISGLPPELKHTGFLPVTVQPQAESTRI